MPEPKGILPSPKEFFGSGRGWLVRDYRGRKVVYHNGGSGAMIAMMPEEKLGVFVLANLYDTGIVSMVMHDVFDRYLDFPQTWTSQEWITEVYDAPAKDAQTSRKKHEAERIKWTWPAFAFEKYAGVYESPLYGTIEIRVNEGNLTLHFGPRLISELSHWQDNLFEATFPNAWKMTTLFAFRLNGTDRVASIEFREGWGWHKGMAPFSRRGG